MEKNTEIKTENKAGVIKRILTAVKGFIVGATMLVPGVSGGSMAMILGEYDELISSVSSFFKHKLKSLIFLLLFVGGAGLGMLLFAPQIEKMMDVFPVLASFFFMGVVVGGVPMMIRKAEVKKFTWRVIVYPVIGAVIVWLIAQIPADSISMENTGFLGNLALVGMGFIAAIGLVLPGISVTYMFEVFGMYKGILNAINTREFLYLLPLVIGLALGIILTTKIIERLLTKYPTATYLMIFGFIIGSVPQILRGFPQGLDILWCILLFIAGFIAIYFLSSFEEKYEKRQKEIEQSKPAS